MPECLVLSVDAPTHGRVLVRPPLSSPPGAPATPVAGAGPSTAPLLVGFHGYAENAERHLAQLERIPGCDAWRLAAVQGLHRFYAGRFEEVVASWMTRQDREQAIADNIAYVDRVVETIRRDHPFSALVFAGFSQGAAMAYRAALHGKARADGIVALGGDVPPDVHGVPGARFPPVLIGRGTRDTWYTDDKLRADVELLRSKGVAVRELVFEGGHEWTDAFRDAAAELLAAVAMRNGERR
jgi:predicted esterase